MAKKPKEEDLSKNQNVVEDIATEETPENHTDANQSAGGDAPETDKADTETTAETPEDSDQLTASENADVDDAEDGITVDATDGDTLADDRKTNAQASEDVAADAGNETVEDDREDAAAADTPEAMEPTPEPQPTVVKETVVERKGGFLPMILGGAVAAGLGFVVAENDLIGMSDRPSEPDPFVAEARAALGSQSGRLDALEAGAVSAQDFASLSGQLAYLEESVAAIGTPGDGMDEVSDALAVIETRVTAFDERLSALEKRPISQGASGEAIAAYERELDALQASVAEQRAEIEAMAEDAAAREAEAVAQAQAAVARGALSQIVSAIDSGSSFAEPLAELEAAIGEAAPAELSALAADGAVTLAELQGGFADAARLALAAARSPDSSDGAGGLGTFLARQLNVRSVQPREGNDPDAVLSRAEAAARGGDMATALAEIETLPEAAASALKSWKDAAQARQDAQAAADALSQRLGTN
ncbi:MAG: hypothetical protein MK098_03210 [Marinovum sp.]|nr:hypothetical protein [Marinovum sp.]